MILYLTVWVRFTGWGNLELNGRYLNLIVELLLFTAPLLFFAATVVDTRQHSKLDIHLHHRVLQNQHSLINREIRVVGECALPLNGRICRVLSRTGVTLLTVTGQVFIAKGTAAQIDALAKRGLVKSLRLSVVQAAKE